MGSTGQQRVRSRLEQEVKGSSSTWLHFLLTSLHLCSSPDAAQEHQGVQPHPQQPERALGGRLGPGAAVPGGLRPTDRRQARGVGEFNLHWDITCYGHHNDNTSSSSRLDIFILFIQPLFERTG